MYQIEVKYFLIKNKFHPADGWDVSVAIDSMEIGKGRQNSFNKREVAQRYYKKIKDLGCAIKENDHNLDIIVTHKITGQKVIIEVEGNNDGKRQKSTSLYSALGQLLVKTKDEKDILALAVPQGDDWRKQISRVPLHTKKRNGLKIYLVARNSIEEL